jgi:alkanesulfonate monooxygenase SsuD/methylene tetrahydromethanopterin reductase-like flavin-dependent oxidoreductase (luciferase family)
LTLFSLLHLALGLDGAGWHPAAWREPEARAAELFTGPLWLEHVREAEAGLLDFVTIEDSHRLQPAGGGGRLDRVRGRLDAIMLAAWLAPRSRGVGIVPAASTTLSEPFLLASQIATLDFAARGRAGWQATVASARADAAYVGPRAAATGAAAWDDAAEHVEVVRALWDSWEDDAEIRDAATNRFFDRRRVHRVDFAGEHLRVAGPSITPRSPQGQPIVVVRASDEPTMRLAATCADVILVPARSDEELAIVREQLDAALASAARPPRSVRLLIDAVVFLDVEPGSAADRRERLDAAGGEQLAKATPIDDGAGGDELVLTSTPQELADRLVGWSELGYDGARLRPGAVPHDLRAITRQLVPELQRRDAFRRTYEVSTLRGLLGFERPQNRFAVRASSDRLLVAD